MRIIHFKATCAVGAGRRLSGGTAPELPGCLGGVRQDFSSAIYQV
jgi:hypothetical protein